MVPTWTSRSMPRRCDDYCSRWTAWWRKDRWQCSRTLVEIIIPRSALQVDSAARELSVKRQNGHFWLPLARRIETSVNPVMVATMEGAAGGRTSTRRWTRSCPWRSGLLQWCGSLANPHQRSDQTTMERTCRSATGVPTASRSERPTQLTGLTERPEGEPPMVQMDCSFAPEKKNMEISA